MRGARETRRTPEGPSWSSLQEKLLRWLAGALSFCARPAIGKGEMPEVTETAVLMRLSAREVDLLADAIAVLWTRGARRQECTRFAVDHPELSMFYGYPEPEPEEDR